MYKIKYSIISILFAVVLNSCAVQIKNVKTTQAHVFGNCGTCKETIEKAGNAKGIAKVEWNKDTKMAKLEYDSIKTNQDVILKRIALAGYDSDNFLAPDEAYNARPQCCQYERNKKPLVKTNVGEEINPTETIVIDTIKKEIAVNKQLDKNEAKETKPTNQLKRVFEKYFALKDALVKTDAKTASANANAMLNELNKIEMNKLASKEHVEWMKLKDKLIADVTKIKTSNTIDKQRNIFMSISESIYSLLKVSNQETTIYYQNCPMANNGKGANWLSTEKAIKNPYYGSEMLNCGSVQETIK